MTKRKSSKSSKSSENALSARYWMLFIAAMSGLMVGSAGGAVFPAIAQLAAPVVCSGEELVTKTTSYTRGPGTSGTRTSVFCVDATGKRSSVNAALAGFVITLELFVPFAIMGWVICAQVWPMHEPDRDDD